jgi:Sodium Bile acid symporter family
MMYPILCKVRYESLHDVFRHREIWKQMAFSIVVNWILAPLLMVCPTLDRHQFRIPQLALLGHRTWVFRTTPSTLAYILIPNSVARSRLGIPPR